MLRLTAEHFRVLANLKQQADGRVLVELLQAALEDTHVSLRTATGEKVGWLQGQGQFLAEWIGYFGDAERLGRM